MNVRIKYCWNERAHMKEWAYLQSTKMVRRVAEYKRGTESLKMLVTELHPHRGIALMYWYSKDVVLLVILYVYTILMYSFNYTKIRKQWQLPQKLLSLKSNVNLFIARKI